MRAIAGIGAAVVLCAMLLTGCGEDPEQPLIEVVDPGPSVTDTDPTPAVDYQPFTLALGNVSGRQGETVEVPLTVSQNAYLVNADVFVQYDPSLLRPVASDAPDAGCATVGGWPGKWWCGEREAGVLQLMFARGDDGSPDALTLCTLKFEVLTDQSAELMLTVSAADVCAPDSAALDALGAALLTSENGVISAPAEE